MTDCEKLNQVKSTMLKSIRQSVLRVLKSLISRKFPDVRWISSQQLSQWIDDASEEYPLVFDSRSEAEYSVSHLKSAKHINPKEPDINQFRGLSPNTPIVVYCSIGYRSARIAHKLQQMGLTQVFNLEGGVFQWANEGRSLVNQGGATSQVHPYNARWGQLLDAQHRSVTRPPSS